MTWTDRTALVAAGLFGAIGVAAAALAAHAGDGDLLRTASFFLLVHAAALPGIAALSRRDGRHWSGAIALLLLVAGVALFAGDLIARSQVGARLFPMAAPAGGIAMIGGWIGVAVSGIAAR